MSAAMLRALKTATLTPGPLPHDGPRGRAFVPADLEREYDQVVVARLDGAQAQPLHDGEATSYKNLMSPGPRSPEFLPRDVAHPNEDEPGTAEDFRPIGAVVAEVLVNAGV